MAVKKTEIINLKSDPKMMAALKKDPAKIIVEIIKQRRSLYQKEIGDWLAGRAAAEDPFYPQRLRLIEIFMDMLLDETVHNHIYNHRILPIQNRAFKIVDTKGVKDEEKTKLFKKQWFDDFQKFCLEARVAYGHSLIYFDEIKPDGTIKKVITIDRRHVLQEFGMIKKWQSDLTGINYRDPAVWPFVFEVGDVYDLGLLTKAVPLWILKKHAWKNWDEFAEIFGIPIRIAKTASDDPKVINEMDSWLQNMGTAAYGIFPAATEIDIKENTKTDSFKVFFEMIDACNKGLATLFSGQSMTSMDGSSRSQAEVHQDVAEDIHAADERWFKHLADELIEKLRENYNYPFDEGDTFEFDVPEDTDGLLTVFEKVNQMGFQLDPEEVSSRLGVKILGIKQVAPIVPEPGEKPEEANPDKPEEDKEDLSVKKLLKLHTDIHQLYYKNVH
ncbi:MAG: DUF935 family protein [Sphingobacteriales bacterium]|nr:DUF935 family protein [Sphingobacteriales bacterium]